MRYAFATAALLLAPGCDTAPGGDAARVPGEIVRNAPDYPALTAPDTVVAGRPFTITTFTAGGGCFRQGDTETAVAGAVAEARPFDLFYDPGPNGACTADLAYYRHTATVTLARPGSATVRVVGTAGRSGYGPPTAETPLVAVEKTVVVAAE